MEYRLNKIDTDVRRKIVEKTKNGKIHKANKIEKQKIDGDKREKGNLKEKNKKHTKNYITIDGERIKNLNVEVDGEKQIDSENSIGHILDKRG